MDKDNTAKRLPFFLIDLMKSVMNDEVGVEDKADVLLFEIGRQLVNESRQPTLNISMIQQSGLKMK